MLQQAEITLQEVLDAFNFGGQVAGTLRYGQGHINDTFCVYVQQEEGGAKRSILQRINTDTFRDPAGLMENIVGVTDYLRRIIQEKGGDPERETLTVVRTKNGEDFSQTALEERGGLTTLLRIRYVCSKCRHRNSFTSRRGLSGIFNVFWQITLPIRCMKRFPNSTIHVIGIKSLKRH